MFRGIVKKIIPGPAFDFIEPYGHWGEAILANLIYGFPALNMKIIGVTGTDGKTTTSTLIQKMLQESGYKVAMMTTISIDYGDGPMPNPTRLTTIGAMELVRQLKKIKAAKPDWLVLETTSHALAQHRVWSVPYSVAVMTNVTHEHLDYHKTIENYRAAKLKLFKQTNRNLRGLRAGIANADDPSGQRFARAIKHPITYGIKMGELRASGIKTSPAGSKFVAQYQERKLDIEVNLPGSFNVSNALAAVGAGVAIGLSNELIERGIAALQSVEGRMGTINEGQDFTVIVDYAHTPESFTKVFTEMRPLTKGRMIAVFGSAGRRDAAKRAIQGEVAGKYCDVVVATEEDDRDEDGMMILDAIALGAEKSGKVRDKNLYLIHDRTEAIQKTIEKAQAGDTVLLLGKGHEKSILGNAGKRLWDESAEAHKALKARLKK